MSEKVSAADRGPIKVERYTSSKKNDLATRQLNEVIAVVAENMVQEYVDETLHGDWCRMRREDQEQLVRAFALLVDETDDVVQEALSEIEFQEREDARDRREDDRYDEWKDRQFEREHYPDTREPDF